MEPAAFIIGGAGILAQIVEPVLLRNKIPVQHYSDLFQVLIDLTNLSKTTSPTLFIALLSELALEDFYAVAILKQQFENASFVCLDRHTKHGNLDLLLKGGKLGLEIATDQATLAKIVNSHAIKMSVKTAGDNTDKLKISSFEQRINSIAGNFFLTSPKTKGIMQKNAND